MSKTRIFFIIGILFLLITSVLTVLGVVTSNPILMLLSGPCMIISLIFMLWGYVVILESINEHMSRNVELMEALVNTLEKGNR